MDTHDGQAAWTCSNRYAEWTSSMDLQMNMKHGHAAWRNEHAALICTCITDIQHMEIQHERGHATQTYSTWASIQKYGFPFFLHGQK
jgi:hypothetical protein